MLHRFFLLASVAIYGCIFGCGGNTPNQNVTGANNLGEIQVDVAWPESNPSRLIPTSSNSIKVTVLDGITPVTSTVITRPASSANLVSVAAGSYTVKAEAFPSNDGTGTPQASGVALVTVAPGETSSVNITLASTIATISLGSTDINLEVGSVTSVIASAIDSVGDLILTDGLLWSSDNPLVATVNPLTGQITGILTGTAQITVTDLESGIQNMVTVHVQPVITILPSSVTLSKGGIQLFAASVIGSANTLVTWSVQEGAAGGSINALGLYTAPQTEGTYHVVATSQADPTKSKTATVTVKNGGILVGLN